MSNINTTIFVIDDDDLVRDSLRALLKSAGYKTETFDSAEMFLNSGNDMKEGVLVLDVQMPGMNGLELQRYLAGIGVALPIIFISAHDNARQQVKNIAGGDFVFLQKPVDANDLFDSIERALNYRAKTMRGYSKMTCVFVETF